MAEEIARQINPKVNMWERSDGTNETVGKRKFDK